LLKKGADVNAVSNVGVTPLHLAVLASNYEIVRNLLNHNANPRLLTILEFTPLMLALSFQDIDMRICELLCSFDIHVGTRLGNPVYCAIKGQHNFAERLILEGADINYIGRIMGAKNSCLLEAISQNDKHLFDLIWPRFNQQLFSKKLSNFLVHFADTCSLKGTELVDCLKLILRSEHGRHLVQVYFNIRKHSFLENFFENLEEYKLTKDDCREIIQALPIVYYDDIFYIYKKFNFNKELQDLLNSYEVNNDLDVERISTHMFIDLLYFNAVQSQSYNLKEILHFLKYHTPDIGFRTHFYNTFSGVGVSTDCKLERLITLYKLCEEIFLKQNIASLQELSRNKLRSIIFSYNKKPYKAIGSLPIPDMFKDILFLKLPIYC
ncbi:Ankyrin repeat-containing protein, partial [Oryctes borbonicus]